MRTAEKDQDNSICMEAKSVLKASVSGADKRFKVLL